MAVIVKFDFHEIERLLREEVARKYNSEVTGVDFSYVDEEFIEVALGAAMTPQYSGRPG